MVLRDLEVVLPEGSRLGLSLNHQKTKVIFTDDAARTAILSSFHGARVIDVLNTCLLGSPTGDESSIFAALEERIELFRCMGNRLKHLFIQNALLLLRHSVAIPKLLYSMKTSPSFLSPQLWGYDALLRTILSTILNILFDEDDPSLIHANLSVCCGGLGVRSEVQLAPSAFLASAAAVSYNLSPPRTLTSRSRSHGTA